MYTIIGGDGKEYGPVTTEQIRTWIAAGRANLETRAKALGTDEWKQLGDFPAFTSDGASVPPVFPSAAPGGSFSAATAPALAPSGRLEISVCYERGWELLKANFWPMVGLWILVMIFGAIASAVVRAATGMLSLTGDQLVASPQLVFKYFGVVFAESFFVSYPLGIGYYYYILKRARGENASASDLFAGFSRVYLPLLAAGFLVGLLTFMGFCCFLLPGIYLAVAYSLTPILIIDRKLGVWEAMEMSRRTVTSQWWQMLAILLIGVLLMGAGVMALLVGFLVAVPLVYCAKIHAYLELFPPAPKPQPEQT